MTLMVNRSDRRFATLSPAMAHEAARLIGNEARGNPSRPGLHLEPNEQAGYMTATEFRIASALRPLHAGGVHIWLAERREFELQYRLVNTQTTALHWYKTARWARASYRDCSRFCLPKKCQRQNALERFVSRISVVTLSVVHRRVGKCPQGFLRQSRPVRASAGPAQPWPRVPQR